MEVSWIFFRKDAFKQIGLETDKLNPTPILMFGFIGKRAILECNITLPITARSPPTQSTIMVKFLVVNCYSIYNMIIVDLP